MTPCLTNLSHLQALMASSPFCHFLKLLRDIQPALSPRKVPTLHAFSDLAKEFTLQESDSTLIDLSKPSEAVSSPKKATLKSLGNGLTQPSKDQVCFIPNFPLLDVTYVSSS